MPYIFNGCGVIVRHMANNEIPEPADPPDQPAPELDPLAPDEAAPFGYMIDPVSGERRAKKRPGRQRVPRDQPSPTAAGTVPVDELTAGEPIKRQEDRSPDHPPRPRGKRARARERAAKDSAPLPPFRAGPIASGINKLYARIGKFVRVMDQDIGAAIVMSTRKESEDDTTVGEAWEEIAKVNPRIRRFLLKLIEGGAWQALFMAHAPILLAVLMKEQIRRHIPFMRLISALLEDDDNGGAPTEVSQQLGGLGPADVQQMMQAAMSMASQMAGDIPRSAGGAGNGVRPPDVVDAAPWSDLPETA